MSDLARQIATLSPKRVALLALELDAKVQALEARAREPLAIVGLACRFPGAPDADAFWNLLRDGVDAVSEVPIDRWDAAALYDPDPEAAGRIASKWGGFLSDVRGFDAAFFGISPREARAMDPQQRLALEVAWEALEDAGESPERLAGTPTGVFLGLCNGDYHQLLIDRGPETIDPYVATGSAHSIASGRVSYTLGLQGPSLSVDTACSSSLVAIHLACQSLRAKESNLAIAGGANVLCSALTTIALSRSRMMASDGRCKAFDIRADGFVRGEGCGLLVLKRLGDAVADGNRILAVIAGSALNQDGRSSGITAPNGPSQEAVIRAALADAGVRASDVAYVEAHGTGTSLGDPIEVRALGGAYGKERDAARPLLIGSAKSNIGHLESAAGVAGVIKAVLALQHGELPPSLHVIELNPHIEWNKLPISVVTERTPWPAGRRLAGVSSFGFSGTNAHIIVGEAPDVEAALAAAERPCHLFTASARTPAALREVARRHLASLDGIGDADLANVCHTSNVGRSHHGERAGLVTASIEELRGQLQALADEAEAPRLWRGRAKASGRAEVVFLFTGQGAQRVGMGKRLYELDATFRATLDRAAAALASELDRPLLDVVFAQDAAGSPLDEPRWAQPATVALELALAEMWRSWGVEPAAVVGHSLGEYGAAAIAGILTFEDALRLVAARGRLMGALSPNGAMAAVLASEADVRARAAAISESLWIAAVNHPEQTVVSGDRAAIEKLVEQAVSDGLNVERLKAVHAFHSPRLEPMLAPFGKVLDTVTSKPARCLFVSTVTGRAIEGGARLDTAYWLGQATSPVRYAAAIDHLGSKGFDVFLEVGPAPVLAGAGRYTLSSARWLATLRDGRDDWDQAFDALAGLYVSGVPVDLSSVDRPWRRRRVALPTYPFEREPYWVEPSSRRTSLERGTPTGHPYLGSRLDVAAPTFEVELDPAVQPIVGDHRIDGHAIVPGPVYFEAALAAAEAAWGKGPYVLEDLTIGEPLMLDEPPVRVQTMAVGSGTSGRVEISSRSSAGTAPSWRRHVACGVRRSSASELGEPVSLDALRGRCTDRMSGDDFRDMLRSGGIAVAAMDAVVDVWRAAGETLVQMTLPPRESSARPALDPSAIEAATLGVAPLLAETGGGEVDARYFLARAAAVTYVGTASGTCWSHAVRRPEATASECLVDVSVLDERGEPVARLEGLTFRRAEGTAQAAAARAARQSISEWLYELAWEPTASATPSQDTRVAWSAPDEIARDLSGRTATLAAGERLDEYGRLVSELDRACAAFTIAAIESLGWTLTPGSSRRGETLAVDLAVVPAHRRLFERLLDVLVEDGVLARSGNELRVARQPERVSGEEVCAAAAREYPAYRVQAELTARCGARLGGVLAGREDPLQLLFEGGSFARVEALYQDSPGARVFNQVFAEAVATLLSQRPAGQRLKVLEVGAGTGGTSSWVLPVFPPQDTEYVYTDVSPLFLERAKEKFAHLPFLRYQTLDIDQEPSAQPLPAGSFDLILAANVLHATRDLGRTLAHVRRLLAPGGALVLLEGTYSARWVDLTFGLTEGWWRFTDLDRRRNSPLASEAVWRQLLDEQGFEVAILPQASEPVGAPQIVVVARDARAVQDVPVALLTAPGFADAALVEAFAGQRRVERIGSLDPADVAGTIRGLAKSGHPVSIVCPVAADGAAQLEDADRRARDLVAAAAAIVRGVHESGAPARLWFVTKGAQAAATGESPDPVGASLWGLGRVVALEHPELWGGLVDVDPVKPADAQTVSEVLQCLAREDQEDQLAWRGGRLHALRLVRRERPLPSEIALRGNASYLVTGGTGGLGLRVAEWLAARGARHIVLVGRRAAIADRAAWDALPPDSREGKLVAAIRGIEAAGARVEPIALDVSAPGGVDALLGRFGREWPALAGIVHAAVEMTAAPVAELDGATLDSMFGAKVSAAWRLHTHPSSAGVDQFVFFSSTTALLGVRGLGHYAAANAFLDALALQRRANARNALSVDWGTWDEMRLATSADRDAFAAAGMLPMPSSRALEVLGRLMNDGAGQAVVAAVDWPTLKMRYEARRKRPLLDRLVTPSVPAGARTVETTRAETLQDRLAKVSPERRADVVTEYVQGEVAQVLGVRSAATVDIDRGLFDLGLDSLMAIDVKTKLERGVGRALPSTLTFNYPTVRALSGFLLGLATPAEPAQTAAAPAPAPPVEAVPTGDISDDLSEDDLAAMLSARLRNLQ